MFLVCNQLNRQFFETASATQKKIQNTFEFRVSVCYQAYLGASLLLLPFLWLQKSMKKFNKFILASIDS